MKFRIAEIKSGSSLALLHQKETVLTNGYCWLSSCHKKVCISVEMCNPDQDSPFCRPISPERVHQTLPSLQAESLPSQTSVRIPLMALANQIQGCTDRISDSVGTKFTGVSDMGFPEITLGKPLVCRQAWPKCRGSGRGAGPLWVLCGNEHCTGYQRLVCER